MMKPKRRYFIKTSDIDIMRRRFLYVIDSDTGTGKYYYFPVNRWYKAASTLNQLVFDTKVTEISEADAMLELI